MNANEIPQHREMGEKFTRKINVADISRENFASFICLFQ